MDNFNELTNEEAERLALLLEECGEVIQICGKILRHGYESFNPFDESRTTNRALLEKELGDVRAAIDIMVGSCDLSHENIEEGCRRKLIAVKKYLHHQ